MNQAKAVWVLGGAAALAALSASLLSSSVMSPLVPTPIHQLLLVWTTGVGVLVVLPVIYLATLLWLWDSARLGVVVLGVSILLAVLSVLYFVSAWEYGVTYQGIAHTRIVAAENTIGLVVVLSLSFAGIRMGARRFQVLAYFLAFAMLSWCAFPYLGELP